MIISNATPSLINVLFSKESLGINLSFILLFLKFHNFFLLKTKKILRFYFVHLKISGSQNTG